MLMTNFSLHVKKLYIITSKGKVSLYCEKSSESQPLCRKQINEWMPVLQISFGGESFNPCVILTSTSVSWPFSASGFVRK